MKLVIDTNIWIGFLIGKTLAGLSDAIANDNVEILFSEELFEELVEVLNRPKFERYFSLEDIRELISLLHSKVKFIEIIQHFNDCRDEKDNFLLDLCVSGEADYLITGDEDLLVMNPFHGIKIINYRQFHGILQQNRFK